MAERGEECYGEPPCKPGEPDCAYCYAKEALKALTDSFEYVIRSLRPDRLSHFPEWVFVDEFRKENERSAGTNHGLRFLELILGMNWNRARFSCEPDCNPAQVTQREADVATAIIQWLGTSCGKSFLWTCEKRIRDAADHDSEMWNLAVNTKHPEQDLISRVAERLAAEFDPDGKKRSGRMLTLRQEIEAEMRYAIATQTKGDQG